MSCGCNQQNPSLNPCATVPGNTAACETLPSQIENFTLHFFGSVEKTESNGVVSWVLPCNLEIGLENNTRLPGEGLACYFLRLFREGIVGLTGPQGETGAAGQNGYNAFTISLASFTQPTLDSPSLQLQTLYNPSIMEGMIIFVQSSGWYEVNTSPQTGILQLTLRKAIDSPATTIPAGRLVLPAGYPGESIVGPTGPQGATGAQGTPGESFTEANGQYTAGVGTDYALQNTPTAIDFVNSSPTLLLPDAGTYLLTATVPLIGLAGIAANDEISIKIRNTSNASDVDKSEQTINNLAESELDVISISIQYTTDGANQTVALWGDCTTSDRVSVLYARTVFNYVRLD